MELRRRSYLSDTFANGLYRYYLDLVDVIEEDILFTATLASEYVDCVADGAARVTVSRCRFLSKLLAFDPTEEFWLL